MNKILSFTYILMLTTSPLTVSGNTELTDPTRPAAYDAEVKEPIFFEDFKDKESIEWKVSAIRISKGDRTAIVNGKLVRVGDDVGPAKVLEIKPLSVVIDHKDNRLIVRLFNNLVVKDYK